MIKRILFFVFLFVMVIEVAFPQTKTVTGKVLDQQGLTIPGVNVLVVGTMMGTQTDINGRYTISVSTTDSLEFSFVGMEKRTFLVGGRTTIDVVLTEKTEQLQQVVVVGYGVQKKESVVGAIGKVDGDELARNATTNSDLTNALTGLVPGVITIKTTGLPGGSGANDVPTEVYIRGISTWNGGQPLILVDGIERPMTDVDPNDITSMSVLKDASATAVFGVKGANGVILITTKRGKKGKPKLTFNASVSANTLSKMAESLGSYDANYLKDIAIENGVPADENVWSKYVPVEVLDYYRTQQYPELYPDVNWADEMTKEVAWSQKYGLNASGGTDFVKYFFSLGYLNEGDIMKTVDYGQGYIPNLGYQRYNFRSNLDFKVTKSTTFTVNLGGYHGNQESIPASNMMRGIYMQPPDVFPVQYSDGLFADYDGLADYPNPVAAINFSGLKRNSRSMVNTDFILKQKLNFITKGLSAGVRVSYDTKTSTSGSNIGDPGIMKKYILPSVLTANPEDYDDYVIYTYPTRYIDQTHGYDYVREPVSKTSESSSKNVNRTMYYSGELNYARDFGKNSVTGLFLFSRQENTYGSDFTHYREDWVGRATYNYGKRYFIEFNGAYNGSEKFDKNYRFGFFPSVAGGWMLSNEQFFKDAFPFVNHMKMRYSWGQVGNDGGIDRWQYVGSWTNTGAHLLFGSPYTQKSPYTVYNEDVVPNPDIHWETATKQNIGFEAGVLKNLISFNFEYFWEHRYDMFIKQEDRLSNVVYGRDLPAGNIGELEAHGWEATLKFSKATMNSMRFKANLSMSRAVNEILYREDPELRPDYMKQEGFTLNQTRTQINQGIIQTWDELYTGVLGLSSANKLPGDFRQVDYNADGVINENDVVPYGYSDIPEYNYSGIFTFGYKDFNLVVQLYGVFNITSDARYGGVGNSFIKGYSIASEVHLTDSWAPELGNTESATYPALRYDTNDYSMGEYWSQDFSYLKIQNVQMQYIFKSSGLKNLGISNLKIYISGNNLHTWSQIPYDFDKRPNNGAVAYSYPLMKNFSLGVNVVF